MRSIAALSLVLLVGAGAASAQQQHQPRADTVDYKCTRSEYGKGEELDLTGATLSFDEEFDTPSIVPNGGNGTWFAPIHGGFGGAKFLPYRPGKPPFLYGDSALTIRMHKVGKQWYSGIIQSIDTRGRGFSQQYGYFEMRAKLPAGQANWPAFWLKSVNQFTDKTSVRTEIDVLEAYGGEDKKGYHATVHLWPAARPKPEDTFRKHWWSSCYRSIPPGLFDGEFHLFGAKITPEFVHIYYDRREIMRFKSLPEFALPHFILVDLAYNKKENRTDTEPSDMVVDYVKVWKW